MTGPQHYRRAEQLADGRDSAGRRWTDAGWRDLISVTERASRRQLDLAEAAIHMGLAQAAAAALGACSFTSRDGSRFGWPYCDSDITAWQEAAGAGK